MGKAWGLNCDRCPAHGSSDYKSMCGSGPPGVMVNPMTNQTEEIDECQLMPGARNVEFFSTINKIIFHQYEFLLHLYYMNIFIRDVPAWSMHQHHG